MSRKKANTVFAIVSNRARATPLSPQPKPIIHGYVIARHGKGALSVARGLIEALPASAFASATTPEMAAQAINAKPTTA